MAEGEPQRKRSRFDQTEPEPKRVSRFDRRSRSPASRPSEARRSRSPVARHEDSRSPAGVKSPADATAAALAAAKKIEAQLQQKKGIQHVDVPPILSATSETISVPPTPRAPEKNNSAGNVGGDIYVNDGDYMKDVEINDLRNRYTLTKGGTQKMIKEETGADVTTRGSYYPDKSMATAANPPLFLHITSTTKEGVEKAVAKIDELMQQELPDLVDQRRFRRREPEQVERDEFGRRKWPEERIPIDIEPLPGFNLRAQVVGQGGMYVKHIQGETRCRVQIKGRGSGFFERDTNAESDETMFLHVTGPDPNEVQRAKELCEDLLANVKTQWQQFKDNPPQRNYDRGQGGYNQRDQSAGAYGGYGGSGSGSGGSGGNGGNGGGSAYGGYGGNNQSSYGGGYGSHGQSTSYGGGYGGAGSPAAPGASDSPAHATNSNVSAAASGGTEAEQWAAWQTWAQQNPEAAAAYYQQYYAQYYPQTAQGTVAQPPAPGGISQSPAPGAPTGPPGASGSYNSVPPPPGM